MPLASRRLRALNFVFGVAVQAGSSVSGADRPTSGPVQAERNKPRHEPGREPVLRRQQA